MAVAQAQVIAPPEVNADLLNRWLQIVYLLEMHAREIGDDIVHLFSMQYVPLYGLRSWGTRASQRYPVDTLERSNAVLYMFHAYVTELETTQTRLQQAGRRAQIDRLLFGKK